MSNQQLNRLILSAVVVLTSFFSNADDGKQPLFIMAKCDGKLSSVVLSSLKDAARTSEKYDLVSNLNNNGRLGLVQTIHLTCAENKEVTAIATQFGVAKCKSATVCHSVIDGLSLNAALCNANLSAGCGRALFKTFDAYIRRPNPTPLKIE
jgi:hypothetical protein